MDTNRPSSNDLVKSQCVVVVPVFNEAAVLPGVLNDLLSCFDKIVVIDDGSTDLTSEIAKSFGVYTARHFQNLGQGASIQTGIDVALALSDWDVLITFDADGQHQVEDAVRIAAELIRIPELEVCLGSRFAGGETKIPAFRRLILRAATLLTNLITGVKLTDTHNGLRAIRRSAAKRITLSHYRMAHATEFISLIQKLNLRYSEIPVHIRYTSYSLAKGQRFGDGFQILFDLLRRN